MTERKKVVILHERENPSTDFFIVPQFADTNKFAVSCFCVDQTLNPEDLDGAIVVIVRYLRAKWIKVIKKQAQQIDSLIYFMDDDLWDWKVIKGLPLRYRFKVKRYVLLYKPWLKRHCSHFWTSSSVLATKYKKFNFEQIAPLPVQVHEYKRVFYHGSASHLAEFKWLVPVIRELHRQREDVVFEIIGGSEVNQLFKDIPRVNVVHPMSWTAFKGFLAIPGRTIGLAPATSHSFNSSRSYTKFFDITTAGAIGVYADNSSSGDFVESGVDGVCLPMNAQSWVSEISRLLDSEAERTEILKNAKDRLQTILHNNIFHD